MKLSTDRNFQGPRGFQKFGGLLLEELQKKHGVKVVGPKEKSDIHLSFIHIKPKKGTKHVLRLDGVYYDVQRLGMNGSIKRAIRAADGVVYQSCWAQKFVEGMFKTKAKLSVVIHNGTRQSKIRNARADDLGFDKVWLCCSHWRVNKRLKSIVQSFLELPDNTCLCIAGKADYRYDHPRVKYFGYLQGGKLFSLYRTSDYFCHICHLDACPNVVVEALSAGLPVLSNNIGGTPELVQDDGVVIPLDKPFDFRPIKTMDVVGPASVNQDVLVSGMRKMMESDWAVDRPDLDISVSARKYYDFFVRLLG